MKHLKNVEKIEEVAMPTPEELDRRELKQREDELQNRKDILEHNEFLIERQQKVHQLELEGLSLQKEEWNIRQGNPLEYEKTAAWEDYLTRLAQHKIVELELRESLCLEQNSINQKQLADQALRCETDIPIIEKRIVELKEKLGITD